MDPNIFRAYDIRGLVGSQLNDEIVSTISRAIGTFFVRNNARRIAVGYDARKSSPGFCELLINGLTGSGIDVILIGMVPTPVLYHTVFTKKVDGGVMITGSHNPPDHNGFKISLGKESIFEAKIKEIGEIASKGNFVSGEGGVESLDVVEDYINDVVSRTELGPRRLKAVIDAGNGMGGVTAVPVYKRLGIETVELFTEPDSDFPNHHPDPSITDNLQDLIAAVRRSSADIGIAFDGDGDRICVVDETGRIIWGDELMVLFSRFVLAEKPGSHIVAEVKCSQTLFDDIEKHGGTPVIWKAGYSLIRSRMREIGAALGGEMSGHIIFADRYYGFDDAAYAGARILEILSKTDKKLSELLADLPKTFSTPELRVDCPEEIKSEVVKNVAEFFGRGHEVITIDGARIVFDTGWGLVRASNTQALLIMRFEARTEKDLNRIRKEVESRVAAEIEAAGRSTYGNIPSSR